MTNESEIILEEKSSGPVSKWLTKNGFEILTDRGD